MSTLKVVGGLIAAALAWKLVDGNLPGVGTPKPERAASSLTERARTDQIALTPTGDPAMEAARAKARAGMSDFLALAAAPKPGMRNFAVKLPVRDDGQVEYFWITQFRRDGDVLVGRLDNTPRVVRNVKEGQTMRFRREELVDWMYVDNGAMKGNFTACALLAKESAAEREKFKKAYGLDCG